MPPHENGGRVVPDSRRALLALEDVRPGDVRLHERSAARLDRAPGSSSVDRHLDAVDPCPVVRGADHGRLRQRGHPDLRRQRIGRVLDRQDWGRRVQVDQRLLLVGVAGIIDRPHGHHVHGVRRRASVRTRPVPVNAHRLGTDAGKEVERRFAVQVSDLYPEHVRWTGGSERERDECAVREAVSIRGEAAGLREQPGDAGRLRVEYDHEFIGIRPVRGHAQRIPSVRLRLTPVVQTIPRVAVEPGTLIPVARVQVAHDSPQRVDHVDLHTGAVRERICDLYLVVHPVSVR